MKKGFTLIELLVVVLIIGVLSAVALPQYQTAVERARATEALTLMNAISESAQRYHSQHESWPNSFTKLDADLPTVSTDVCSSGYGGKNFCLSFSAAKCAGSTSGDFCVEASRRRDSHAYILRSNIVENANGTYSTTRSCSKSSSSADNEAQSYCDAITGGNNTNF